MYVMSAPLRRKTSLYFEGSDMIVFDMSSDPSESSGEGRKNTLNKDCLKLLR